MRPHQILTKYFLSGSPIYKNDSGVQPYLAFSDHHNVLNLSSNTILRLEKNGNRLIFSEKGSLVESYDRTKTPQESPDGKYSFSAKIQNGRLSTWQFHEERDKVKINKIICVFSL